MSEHILSKEEKHTGSFNRQTSQYRPGLDVQEGKQHWVSFPRALISESHIASKCCSQTSPGASTVGWIICMIDCRSPGIAFLSSLLRPIMSITWHDTGFFCIFTSIFLAITISCWVQLIISILFLMRKLNCLLKHLMLQTKIMYW